MVPAARRPQPLPFFPAPTSIVVWGTDRARVDRVALALARAVGAELYWFEILDPSGRLSAAERRELGKVDRSHAFRLRPGEVAPDAELGSLVHGKALAVEPNERGEGERLAALLRIPAPIRQVVLDRDPELPTAAFVLTNTDRAAALYPRARGTFAPLITTLKGLGLTLILTTGRSPQENAQDFDLVLRVEPGGTGPVVVERGDVRLGPTFRRAAETPLPAFLRALREHPAPSTQGAP
jgi:hypothetical protein